eukprot:148477-Prymnesium_polylepis.1
MTGSAASALACAGRQMLSWRQSSLGAGASAKPGGRGSPAGFWMHGGPTRLASSVPQLSSFRTARAKRRCP